MTRFSKYLFGAITVFCFSSPAIAQEHAGCFMVDGMGRTILLSDMCPQADAQTTAQPAEDNRAIAYAAAYCQARKDGYPGDVARSRGVSAMQDASLMQHGGNVDAVLADSPTDAVINDALDKAAQLCPEFE